jgi:deoxyadenosine/deoxycytidine kinase
MEVFFMKERFRDLLEISKSSKDIIQDRTIYEGVYVFTENNHRMGNLDDRDYEAYMELFGAMEEAVKLPDLMIYLHSSVPHLVKNIQKRGRSFEQEIPIEYLQNLNDLYEEFIREKYKGKVLLFNVDDMDYEHVPKDFGKIIDKIDAEIYGLFSFNEK